MRLKIWTFVIAGLAAVPAAAAETVTYSYDALGRLVSTSSSGSVNNGVAAASAYDAAGNRTNYTVTGSGFAGGTVTLALAGMTVVPLGNPGQ